MKTFIANIPIFLAKPIQFVTVILLLVTNLLIHLSKELHKTLETPLGAKLQEAEALIEKVTMAMLRKSKEPETSPKNKEDGRLHRIIKGGDETT